MTEVSAELIPLCSHMAAHPAHLVPHIRFPVLISLMLLNLMVN